MKAAGAIGLAAAILVAATLPVWSCFLCAGPGSSTCPACRGAGRASLAARALSRPSDILIRDLFKEREAPRALDLLLLRAGARTFEAPFHYKLEARFIGPDRVLVLVHHPLMELPARQRAAAAIFSGGGELRSQVEAFRPTRAGGVGVRFEEGELRFFTGEEREPRYRVEGDRFQRMSP